MDLETKSQIDAVAETTEYLSKNQLARELSKKLLAKDVTELVTLSLTGSEHERDAAIRILKNVQQENPEMFTSVDMQRWLSALRATTVQFYPKTVLGTLSYSTLFGLDRRIAEEFLATECHLDGLSDSERRRVAKDLAHFSTNPGAIDRLRALASISDASGEEAKSLLEGMGFLSEERIRELAEAWREQRSPKALSDLYYKYITNIPAGDFPLAKIVALLGPPTGQTKNAVWYEASPGTALYLEADENGNLSAFRLS